MKTTLCDCLHQSMAKFCVSYTCKYAMEIAKILSKLHRFKFVHKSLKTSIIFLDHDFRCQLGDFGACSLGKHNRLFIGTPPFALELPSQLKPSSTIDYDGSAIVFFAFGLILYELLPKEQYHCLSTHDLLNIGSHMNALARWKKNHRQYEKLVLDSLQPESNFRSNTNEILETF